MRTISVGKAIGAGFRLIARDPTAFLAWCGVYFLIGVLPQGLALGPAFAMMRELAAGATPTSPEVLQIQAQAMRYQPLSYLALLLMVALLLPAIYRAVLRPADRGVFYFRLGARELWMTVTVVALVIIWILALIVAMIPLVIIIGVAAATSGGSGAGGVGLAGVGVMLLVFGGTVWAGLRLSFAPVMSFADATFRLPESWRLTRGHAGRLFLVALCLFLLMLVIEAVLFGGAFAVFAATAPDFGPAMMRNPAALWSRIGWPGLTIAGLLLSLFGGWAYVMWGAAWAEMYRELTFTELDVF